MEQTPAYQAYSAWLEDRGIDEATKKELRSIEGQTQEIEDRFYKELEFGTGGLRGVIGAGTNRINRYTVGKATQGLALYIRRKQPAGTPSVAIAYDSRHRSPEFAEEAALVLAGNGIRAYVFDALRPTPELSFAVRKLGAAAGIVITASHNPPEYNGYKVYGADGGQLVPDEAEQVIREIRNLSSLVDVKKMERAKAEAEGLLQWIGEDIDDAYLQAVTGVSLNSVLIRNRGKDFRIVFTPLHGTGNMPVRGALERIGFASVTVVKEQEAPDADFSTVKSPNPEEREAFALALKQAEAVDADIIIGTDPDADRMGAVVKNDQGEYVVLSGNQSGALMLHYLLNGLKERGQLPGNGAVVKTIVTSELGARIAESFGLTVFNTLTGFKYIGEKMTRWEQTDEYAFMFGYEESYGYLAGNYARDKDAVVASMLICEAAAYYKTQGRSLYDVLNELYAQHGYHLEQLQSRTMKGKTGMEAIGAIMDAWRHDAPEQIANIAVTEKIDYAEGIDDLPKENALKFRLADDSWFCLRPSGTEPKIKIYFAVNKPSRAEAEQAIRTLSEAVMSRIGE